MTWAQKKRHLFSSKTDAKSSRLATFPAIALLNETHSGFRRPGASSKGWNVNQRTGSGSFCTSIFEVLDGPHNAYFFDLSRQVHVADNQIRMPLKVFSVANTACRTPLKRQPSCSHRTFWISGKRQENAGYQVKKKNLLSRATLETEQTWSVHLVHALWWSQPRGARRKISSPNIDYWVQRRQDPTL